MKVDIALGLGSAGVRSRAELPDQAHLLEGGGELGPCHAPLDPIEPVERRLDRGPLAPAVEVRPQPGPEIARLADVEDVVIVVAKQVDAGPLGAA